MQLRSFLYFREDLDRVLRECPYACYIYRCMSYPHAHISNMSYKLMYASNHATSSLGYHWA